MVSERISVHEPTFEEMVTDFPDSVKGLLQTARQKLLQIHYVDGFRSPYQE